MTKDEIVWAILLTIAILVVGTATIQYQCRRLRKKFRDIKVQRHRKMGRRRRRQEGVIISSSCTQELREVGNRIHNRQLQNYQSLADELESMRQMQRDVRGKLAGLQTMVDQATKKQKQRDVANSRDDQDVDNQKEE